MSGLRFSGNLDLLRSTAVLLVLADHLFLFFRMVHPGDFFRPLGRWGVLLFFVHTSFVLMMALERQWQPSLLETYAAFVVRRGLRIYPLSIAVVTIVAVLQLPLGHFREGAFVTASFGWRTVLSNLLLVQNLTGKESILDPLWTLPYEMQMYLWLPLLFHVTGKMRGPVPAVLIWGTSVVAAKILQSLPFGYLVLFLPCFFAGVVAYHVRRGTQPVFPYIACPVVLIAASLLYFCSPRSETGWLCCLLVGAVLPLCRELPAGLVQRACHTIARYSYGIYLTHGIFIWLAFARLASWPAWAQWAIFILGTIAGPVLLYHVVEAPMIAWGAGLVRRWTAPGRAATHSLQVAT